MKTMDVQATLAKTDVHDQWESDYRTQDNAKFYDEVFDEIARALRAPANAQILDAGCGVGALAVRLARRGFKVKAIDFSQPVVERARDAIKIAGYSNRISVEQMNLMKLAFSDETFEYALCWGVLMHIPEVERVVSELARVLTPGGVLVISEGNMHSVDALLRRSMRPFARRRGATIRRTKIGLEYWTETPAGVLLTRQADVNGLRSLFESSGLIVKRRIAGQFTELYTSFRSQMIKKAIYTLNHIWFRYVKAPQFSFGNIWFLEKPIDHRRRTAERHTSA
jgi:2-polyprenyl-3-methyl-5-hydroxy-6-metoxy-1,4-benzoquinol methylase